MTANPTAPVVRLCPGRRRNAKSVRQKVVIGSLVTREWRKVRNSKHHRMRFAWVPEIFAAIEHLGLFGNAELLRAHLTLQTEFVHVIVNPATGEVSRIPRSWAYSSLDENDLPRWRSKSAITCSATSSSCASSAASGTTTRCCIFSDGGGSMIATHKHRKSGALVTLRP